MWSSVSKLFSGDSKPDPSTSHTGGTNSATPTFKPMSARFHKVKVIIRGDVMTGKSSLFARLQGIDFEKAYTTTPHIQVANIPWKSGMWSRKYSNYAFMAAGADIPSGNVELKLENAPKKPPKSAAGQEKRTSSGNLALDATTIDVYRNTNAVIFLFDVTKQWTFDYVVRELANVPHNLAVLVVANFTDMSDKRVVQPAQVANGIHQYNRKRARSPKPSFLIRYIEASMFTAYGLEFIYKYLGVPFLELQKEILRQQLERKTEELTQLIAHLDSRDEIPEEFRVASNSSQDAISTKYNHVEVTENRTHEDTRNEGLWKSAMPSPGSAEIPLRPVAPSTATVGIVSSLEDNNSVDQFNAGEISADFFDEVGDVKAKNSSYEIEKARSMDELAPNPLVAGDEDVGFENISGRLENLGVSDEEEESTEWNHEVNRPSTRGNVFGSTFSGGNVWDRGDSIGVGSISLGVGASVAEVSSDSEEDLSRQLQTHTDIPPQGHSAGKELKERASFGGAMAGSASNPWLEYDQSQPELFISQDNIETSVNISNLNAWEKYVPSREEYAQIDDEGATLEGHESTASKPKKKKKASGEQTKKIKKKSTDEERKKKKKKSEEVRGRELMGI
ncbi:uncharacterized protein VTP21DRAFT_5590 [Calcarisporiella thermophila]|uniref:uncharacterized protein n=1 Tax=Calcarisporiella thermophila TaxID=911321 RepID=UPI0037447EF7